MGLLISTGFLLADEWPQWLGPDRDGISREREGARILARPRAVWSASVGSGCSSPVVAGGRCFVMGHERRSVKRGVDTVFCLDAATGSKLWEHAYDCITCVSQDVKFDGPRSTPTVDGPWLYTLSAEGHLFCLESTTGEVRWSSDLVRDLSGRIPVYGYCGSPLVHGDHLILEVNAPAASYVALDKASGRLTWQLGGGDVTCGSPVITRVEGRDWVVFAGGGSIVAADAATGEFLWRHRTWGHGWMGPVVSSNRVFMANASLPRGCGVIRVDRLEPRVVWENRETFQTLHCNALIHDQHIYGVDNTGTDYQGADSKKSALKCLALETGQVCWMAPRTGWGNVLLYGAYLLLLRETGELVVLRAVPDRYLELARAPVLPGPTWTPPALADGRLYARNKTGQLVCVRIRAEPGEAALSTEPTAPAPKETSETPRQRAAVSEPVRTGAFVPPGTAQRQWPRFRGPRGLGISPHTNVPTAWNGRTGAGILWKAAIPLRGHSSPVIWGDRLWITGADGHQREVYCYQTDTGTLTWRRAVDPAAGTDAGVRVSSEDIVLAAPTAVVDDRYVHVMFGTGDLAALDHDGNWVWSRTLGLPDNPYGHAASLVRWRDLLLIQLDQGTDDAPESRFIAIEADSGQTRWETRRAVPSSWSTPIVVEDGGHPAAVACGGSLVVSYRADTGEELWRASCLGGEVVPSPVSAGGLILAGSVDGQLAAIRLGGRGDVTGSRVVWAVEDDVPAICSPVCDGELVYLVNSGGTMVCLEVATGQRLWEHDLGGHFQASPTLAERRLYLLSDDGTMIILRPGRDYQSVGQAAVGEPCAASPAFQDGRIFVRGERHLFGIGSPSTGLGSAHAATPGGAEPKGTN